MLMVRVEWLSWVKLNVVVDDAYDNTLNEDIQRHGWEIKTLDQTLGIHAEWTVSLVVADGKFNLNQGFLWACMGQLNTLSTQREEWLINFDCRIL